MLNMSVIFTFPQMSWLAFEKIEMIENIDGKRENVDCQHFFPFSLIVFKTSFTSASLDTGLFESMVHVFNFL